MCNNCKWFKFSIGQIDYIPNFDDKNYARFKVNWFNNDKPERWIKRISELPCIREFYNEVNGFDDNYAIVFDDNISREQMNVYCMGALKYSDDEWDAELKRVNVT